MNPIADFVVNFLGKFFRGAAIGRIGSLVQNWGDAVQQEAHNPDALQELCDALVERIRARTPELTGALQSSITGEVITDQGDTDLLYLYADSEAQEMAWNRIYAGYQEGPPLGLETYTNAPHLMFFSVQTDDMDLIDAYCQTTGQNIQDFLVLGQGQEMQ